MFAERVDGEVQWRGFFARGGTCYLHQHRIEIVSGAALGAGAVVTRTHVGSPTKSSIAGKVGASKTRINTDSRGRPPG